MNESKKNRRKTVNKPEVTNDILSPCNKNKCTSETIAACCGCPEWFRWNEQQKNKNEYIGKHLKKEN